MKKLLGASTVAITLLAGYGSAIAITNGTPDTDNPYVGAMTGLDPGGTERLCSGSLIAEGVFLTAGHCAVLSDVELHFGDDLTIDETTFEATAVLQHPDYSFSLGKSYDVGVVLFDQGDDVLPLGTLAGESYVNGFTRDDLRDATFETIGYGLVRGDTNGNSAPLMPSTERLIATQSYLNMHNQYLGLSMNNNQGNGGACFGDSGGPHLLDGQIVSVTSNGDANCVTTDNTQRVDQPEIRDWILSFVD